MEYCTAKADAKIPVDSMHKGDDHGSSCGLSVVNSSRIQSEVSVATNEVTTVTAETMDAATTLHEEDEEKDFEKNNDAKAQIPVRTIYQPSLTEPEYFGTDPLYIDEGDQSSNINPSTETKVKFGQVEVREYAITIGDSPYCSGGPPLSLDWEYRPLEIVSVDTYEFSRKNQQTV